MGVNQSLSWVRVVSSLSVVVELVGEGVCSCCVWVLMRECQVKCWCQCEYRFLV